MNDLPFSASAVPVPVPIAAAPRRPWYHWRRWGFNFLTISVAAHLLFGVGATYLIVQTIQAKRKQTFAAPASGPSAPQRAIEHKVQMQKKQQTMSAPAPVKRITTTSNAKVALPAMPAMPKLDAVVTPLAMAGMGGTGMGLGLGSGGGGGNGNGGGGLSLFGLRTAGAGLPGTFYDLKQTRGKQPTGMNPKKYGEIIGEFAANGFNVNALNRFYRSEKPLYATQIWIPRISASLGPAAFGLEKEVEPKMWCVHYKGNVVAPGSFTFHFVGAGDDVMIVRFNGKLVLVACWFIRMDWKAAARYSYNFSFPGGFAKGDAIQVEAGRSYPIEIVIGEQPGGRSFATLLQEIEGASYDKDPKGNPILPVFRLSNARADRLDARGPFPTSS